MCQLSSKQSCNFVFRWNIKHKQKFLKMWGEPKLTAEMLVNLGGVDIPGEERDGGQAKALCLIGSVLGLWKLEEVGLSKTTLPLAHTMKNHEMVAYLLLFNFLPGRCWKHELLWAQLGLFLLLCLLNNSLGDRCISYEDNCLKEK